MTYKYVHYVDGVPSGSAVTKTVTPTLVDGSYVFEIYLNEYSVGDELKEFKVSASGSSTVNLWDTNEGINILCNGEIIDVMPVYNNTIETETVVDDEGNTSTRNKEVTDLHRNKFALNFLKDGDYKLQAVYRGNNATELSATDYLNLHIKQEDDDGGSGQTGIYKLEFVNKNLSKLTYDDKSSIQFRLTRGGNPVSQKTIEMARPNGAVGSQDTNASGIVGYLNNGFDCGTYKLGAYFVNQQDDDNDGRKVVSTYKTVIIQKATPVFSNTASPVALGTKLQIKLKDHHGNNMPNQTVAVYVNGKVQTSKTNDNGNVWISFKKTGTYKIKAVYNGNKNFKAITKSFNFKVNNG